MLYTNKTPYVANFRFAESAAADAWQAGADRFPFQVTGTGAGVFRLTAPLRAKGPNPSQAELDFAASPAPDAGYALTLGANGGLVLADAAGRVLLESWPGKGLGLCGDAHMLCFRHRDEFRYYGMGEKLRGLELTGVRTRFWNTDSFADFDWGAIENARVDPYYASIPYLIIRTPAGWAGLLMNTPYPAFMSTAAEVAIEGFQAAESSAGKMIALGAEGGGLDLFVIAAPTLAELTCRFQKLVGPVPLPPLWALGYHQCRWGYRSADDLRELKRRFAEHEIPVDGLWLDIDYMDGFRVFTLDKAAFPNGAADIAEIADAGQRVVPIIDPGVKRDEHYEVYREGRDQDLFCRNPEGGEYIGLVWPGESAFPDFSLAETRAWWAERVKKFAELGFEGAWLDMNDPSTGAANPYDMLFGRGTQAHETFHNQYAAGMAQASRAGFLQARPDQRPFLVTRSNFLAGGRHAAIWTGDSVSNYAYLRKGLPTCLNLALSGMPFTGGDIGGFAGNVWPRLLRDWMKASFLLPFCRNHACIHTAAQEPWAHDALTLETLREMIRARYKLLPYLYQLFAAHEETGAAILRPLFHDFDNTPGLELDRIEDAYLLGPALLHAPVVEEGQDRRDVPLPGPGKWFSVLEGAWVAGGAWRKDVAVPETATPLYVRDGSIVPLRPGIPTDHRTALDDVELHVFLSGDGQSAETVYVADDGLTFAYRRGGRSRLQVRAAAQGGTVELEARLVERGAGPVRVRFAVHGPFTGMRINGELKAVAPLATRLAGCDLAPLAAEPVRMD
jgi:alpha-glucosidase